MTFGLPVNAVAHGHGEKQKAVPEAALAVEPMFPRLVDCGLEAVAVSVLPPAPVPVQLR